MIMSDYDLFILGYLILHYSRLRDTDLSEAISDSLFYPVRGYEDYLDAYCTLDGVNCGPRTFQEISVTLIRLKFMQR